MSLSWINAINTPTEWAEAQLSYMHLPVTSSNIELLVSWAAMEGGAWHNTASYNPLNTTQQYAGSHVMSGGNSAGVQAYANWADGLGATAETLNYYPQIIAALQGGNAMAVNQSGGLAGSFEKWSDGGYSQIGANTSYGSFNGSGVGIGGAPASSTTAAGGSTGTGGTGLTMANMPGIEAYIQANYPEDAWMLTIPEVATILENAAIAGTASQNVIAEVEATNWWRTTSAAMRQYEQTAATNPGELQFTVAGSQANQILAQLKNLAGQNGVDVTKVPEPDWQALSIDAIKYGWTTQQMQAAIGAQFVKYNGPGGNDTANSVIQQLQAQAGQYLMSPNDPTLQSWAQNIVGGTQTIQQFDAYMKQNASTKWTGMAPMIAQGYTPAQIVAPLTQSIATTLEISPDQVNYVTDPKYAKILDYVDPTSKTGVHSLMTQSQALQYVKSDPAFGFQNTQTARDSAAQLEQTMTQEFGKVAS